MTFEALLQPLCPLCENRSLDRVKDLDQYQCHVCQSLLPGHALRGWVTGRMDKQPEPAPDMGCSEKHACSIPFKLRRSKQVIEIRGARITIEDIS